MKTMLKLTVLALVVTLLCSFMIIPASAAETKNAVVDIELKGERNVEGDPSPIEVGWGGAAITVGDKDIVVTAVGRMFFSAGNISHGYLVVNQDGSLVASGIAVQGFDDSVDGTFEYYYFDKSEYITLYAGLTYFFCTDFYGPMDKFYDSSTVTSSEDISFIGKVDLNLADGSWIYTEMPGVDYLPIDFQYYVVGEETSEPSATEPSNTQPAGNTPSAPTNNGNGEPAPSMDLGLIIGIAAAVVVVVVVVIVVVAKKKKS